MKNITRYNMVLEISQRFNNFDNFNKNDNMSIIKTVNITKEQEQWIKERAINFSKWVRKKIDEEIKRIELLNEGKIMGWA